MRLRLGTVSVGVLLLAGCTSATAPTTSSRAHATSSTAPGTKVATTSSTSTTMAPVTTAADVADPPERASEIGGALPDGTPYTVRFDRSVDQTVQSIRGAVMIDRDDGTSWFLGRAYLSTAAPTVEAGLDEALGRYTVHAGDGSATILIADNVADQYPDIEDLLSGSISPGTGSKLPNLELSPPLRWATDDELPVSMEVRYDGFIIRRGCGELAAKCNATGVVQVILESELYSGAPGLLSESVWIDSPRPRPVDSASYVDPGPLSIRGQHDVLWTGDEMIVWGGADGDNLPTFTDGAAFNPETAEWRMLPPFPIDRATVSRAVWADTRMIVIAAEGAFAYEPANDEWSAIGDGLFPSQYAGMTVWTGDVVATWTAAGIYTFDPEIGTWSQLPDPGGGAGDQWDSALRVVDGTLYAIGSAGYCGGRWAARWTGDAWVSLPRVELDGGEYADCAYPNQIGVAGDRLIAWEDNIHQTKAFDPDTDTWLPIETIPLDGTEGPSGPLQLANGFLVPQYGEAAIFDEVSGDWYHVILPGSGENTEMVWTGYEVLMWGQPCCYGDGRDGFVSMDAWRWTPPDADGTD